ncbi:hypothetical protein CBOM_07724 [Ceraceosorus bombacis]|uniref:Uncharacterized protein n=1 Tax=Ceraceosorus bombacis TaxID=401625 RepID=A0A0P1BB12_9BASI|nr:hypothetical protein CBOM_07724 [Ceraceosorus bombacis]
MLCSLQSPLSPIAKPFFFELFRHKTYNRAKDSHTKPVARMTRECCCPLSDQPSIGGTSKRSLFFRLCRRCSTTFYRSAQCDAHSTKSANQQEVYMSISSRFHVPWSFTFNTNQETFIPQLAFSVIVAAHSRPHPCITNPKCQLA